MQRVSQWSSPACVTSDIEFGFGEQRGPIAGKGGDRDYVSAREVINVSDARISTQINSWVLTAALLGIAPGCGGGATQSPVAPVTEPTPNQSAQSPASVPGVSGQLLGRTFAPAFAAIVWDWPGDWKLRLSDRAPDERGNFGDGAVLVDVNISDAREIQTDTEIDAGSQIEVINSDTPAPQGATSSAVTITNLRLDVDLPADAVSYPRLIGAAHVRLNFAMAAAEDFPAGNVAGEADVPVMFLSEPHRACQTPNASLPTNASFTEAPTARTIPTGPVVGNVRGHRFEARTIAFRKLRDGWELMASTSETLDTGIGEETLHVSLEGVPRRGTVTKAMGTGGFFQVCRGLGTTSWNTDSAHILQITAWNPRPCATDANGNATAGTASGKIYVAYKGFDEVDNSWVAGTFTDVAIVPENGRCE